jgi:tetratricopeptide (TPR) repeat protein
MTRLVFPVLFVVPLLLVVSLMAGPAENGIRFFEERVRRDPDDFISWNQLADRYQRQLRRTGEERFIGLMRQAAEQSLKAVPAEQNTGGLAALAQAQLTAHRFADARNTARQLRDLLPDKSRPLELLVDAALELGEYEEARKLCEELKNLGEAGIAVESRFARLEIIAGHNDRAREHFENGLNQAAEYAATQPNLIAWFHLQLGELAFKTGDWEKAAEHYASAEKAAPDWYAAADHLAELHAARGQIPEAIALYEKLTARTPRPEFFQALGDLHTLANEPEKAAQSLARAEELYLRSTSEGAVHFFHHLAGFYADSKPDPAKAIEWARKDLELRKSIYAWDALAWALYKNGQAAEAAKAAGEALATGTRDPHLLYHAGLIRLAAGDILGGRTALQEATAVNPRFNTFHVHR